MTLLNELGLSIDDFIELCDNSLTMKQASKEMGIPFNEFKLLANEFFCWRNV